MNRPVPSGATGRIIRGSTRDDRSRAGTVNPGAGSACTDDRVPRTGGAGARGGVADQ